MKLVEFKPKHIDLLREIYESRHISSQFAKHAAVRPKIGFLALLGEHPIAVGFLRKVEGGFGQIDTLASSAYFGSQIRHEGIKLVVDELIVTAKQLKLKGIMSFTQDEGVIKRAKEMGFHEVNQTLIALELT